MSGIAEIESKELVAQDGPAGAVRRVESNPLLMPTDTWNRLKQLAQYAVESGLLPKSVDTAQKAFVVALKGHELGFSPMYAMEHIVVINGKATIDGQGMLRLVLERVPGARVDFVTPPDKQDRECEVEMQRPRGKPARFRFTMDDAKRAGLLDKSGPWKQYPRAMLRWRAVSEGARVMFPDAIAGLYLHEEMGANVNEAGEVIDVTAGAASAPAQISESAAATSVAKAASSSSDAPQTPPPTPDASDEEPVRDDAGVSRPTQPQLARLHAIKKESGWSDEALRSYMRANFAKESTKDLTWLEYRQACKVMQENPIRETTS